MLDSGRVARVREDMERAEARRLQPRYIESRGGRSTRRRGPRRQSPRRQERFQGRYRLWLWQSLILRSRCWRCVTNGIHGAAPPRRFHGVVTLDPARAGRDARRIADEAISHFAGLDGASVTVTLEIEATIPAGASG